MIVYWLLFACLALAALQERSQAVGGVAKRSRLAGWFFSVGVIALVVGFRYEVGADWDQYLWHVNRMVSVQWSDLWRISDPGYAVFNWIGYHLGGGIFLTNILSAAIFLSGVAVFARSQTRPWLAMVVAMPYLILVVGMGYTRQAVALGVSMVAMNALLRGQARAFMLWVALAVIFHKTALVLLGFLLLTKEAKHWANMLLFVLFGGALFFWFIKDHIAYFNLQYLEGTFESSGATIRVMMNALPALIFLSLRDRFQLTYEDRRFWTRIAWLAISFVFLLMISPSSTAVDRIALYLTPIQLFVWSRLPDALGHGGKVSLNWTTAIVGYSALVLFVWLNFATHAAYWVPYRFYPLQWFWSL